MKKIQKSIVIKASKEKVWDVLTLEKYTRDWYTMFHPDSRAITDWKEGSKALFVDSSNSGMLTKVIENIHARSLKLEYTGLMMNGEEDSESAEAKKYIGGKETYDLLDDNGGTKLDISSDMEEKMFEMMSNQWDKALERLKQLAEN